MRRRIPRWIWIAIGALAIVGAPVAWYLGSPLFINRTVNEPHPSADVAGTVVARGTFTGRDDFHRGSGTATVYRTGQTLILRLDPFTVTNGPDLHVILVRHPSPKTPRDVEGYLEVAKLKGNLGSQNYTLPAGVEVADYRTVVIYCMPFHVVFATAPLAAPN